MRQVLLCRVFCSTAPSTLREFLKSTSRRRNSETIQHSGLSHSWDSKSDAMTLGLYAEFSNVHLCH